MTVRRAETSGDSSEGERGATQAVHEAVRDTGCHPAATRSEVAGQGPTAGAALVDDDDREYLF